MRFLLLTTHSWNKAQRIIFPVYIDFTWKDNTKKKEKTVKLCLVALLTLLKPSCIMLSNL